MIKLYERGDSIISVIMMDIEFDKVVEILGNVEVNIAEAREHVVEVDRTIITLKEQERLIINTLT